MIKKNKQGKILLFTLALLCLTAGSFATDQNMPWKEMSDLVIYCEDPTPEPCAFSYITDQSIPCEETSDLAIYCEESTPGPCAFSYAKDVGLSCPKDFYLNATFLLMQAKEDGLDYAVKQCSLTDLNTFPLQEGDIQGYTTSHNNTTWNYGMRLNGGFYLNHDNWDLGVSWTYFRINNDEGNHLDNGILLPLWLDPNLIPSENCIASSARWTGKLHTLDLRLGKPYHISRKVIFNPHFGFRFGWIAQDFLVKNGGMFSNGENTDDGVDMLGKNNFWGLGARAGMDSEWHLKAGWYLFGNASAALLYSHFDIIQNVSFDNNIHSQLKNDFYTVIPNAEICLGLCWNTRFRKDKYLIALKAAYEFHAWFAQNRMRRFFDSTAPSANDEVARADLYLSGFAFSLGFEF